jgi:hypothetical protein
MKHSLAICSILDFRHSTFKLLQCVPGVGQGSSADDLAGGIHWELGDGQPVGFERPANQLAPNPYS